MGETTALAAESFCDVVREHARSQGDVAAFTYAGEDISFAEIDAGADRVANGLAALGVKPGDRVAFLGKNHPLYFEAFLGANRIGAVMTPVNWRLAPPEVAYVLDNSQARVVFVGEGFAEVLGQIRSDCPHVEQVIGIDAPDFNLGVERWLKQRGVRTVHHVSPSVWAWRESRAKKIGQSADRVLCLFPMEPPIYAKHGVDAVFVGHPMADDIPPQGNREEARAALVDAHVQAQPSGLFGGQGVGHGLGQHGAGGARGQGGVRDRDDGGDVRVQGQRGGGPAAAVLASP